MDGPILVTYASRYGATREVAEAVAEELRGETRARVDVCAIQDVRELAAYRAVVIGSAGRRKRGWLREARHFVRDHETELSRVPVAYFMTCWCLRNDTPETRREAARYVSLVEEYAPAVKPFAVGLFAGKWDMGKLSAFDRFMMRLKHAPASGDWRDWQAIRAWASDLARLLDGASIQTR
jgi:menaquinone-dependent protoporphyrinogen oxidase